MWPLFGLLVALAAVSDRGARNTAVSDAPRSPVITSRMLTYCSRDGSARFRFRFTPLRYGIRIHVLEFPNPSVGSCHVLHDAAGIFICWSAAIGTMAAAKAVAATWAEATLVYQRTGRTF